MTIGSDVLAKITQTNAQPVATCSINSEWSLVRSQTETIDAGGSTITNPTTGITASDNHDFISNGAGGTAGTHLVPMWRWDASKSPINAPQIVAFGRTDDGSDDSSPEPWVQLRTKAGSLTWQPTYATYTTDGTYKYTIPNLSTDPFDRMGCNRVRFGIQIDGTYTGGDLLPGAIYAKPI